jgi:hypothetical protein
MKRLIYTLLLFASLGANAQETFSVNGVVNDKKGSVIPGATVFIANSKFITATDNVGAFNLGNLKSGTYEVVIKMLGFEPFIRNITCRFGPAKAVLPATLYR